MLERLRHPPSASLVRWNLVGMLLIGFWLRAYKLGEKNVWWDEGLASWISRESLAEIGRWNAFDVHPPLYFWLLSFWRELSGGSAFGLRLLSVFIGLLTIVATYQLGKRVGGRWTGLWAGWLITIARFNVGWSQEMRMYALAALLGVVGLWAALGVWRWGRRRDQVAYVLAMTAGLYTLYLSVMVLVAANLVWLFGVWPRSREKGREFVRWSLLQVGVLLLFAPWLAYAINKIPTWSQARAIDFGDFLKIYWAILSVGIPLDVDRYWLSLTLLGLVVLLSMLVLLWTAQARRQNRRPLALLLVGLALPAIVIYVVSRPNIDFFYSPPLAPRYLILFLGAFVVLVGWGIAALQHSRWPLVGLLAAIIAGVPFVQGMWNYHGPRVLKDDYQALVDTLSAYRQPDQAVILYTDTDWPIFAHYYADSWNGVPAAWQMDAAQAEAFLDPLWQESEGVWLVTLPYAAISDSQNHVPGWLAQRAESNLAFEFGDKFLTFFAKTAPQPLPQLELVAGGEPQWPVEGAHAACEPWWGYDQPATEFSSGSTLRLAFYGEVPAGTAVALALQDANGLLWPLTEFAPASETGRRTLVTAPLSADLPGGQYQLSLQTEASGEACTFGRLVVRTRRLEFLTREAITIPQPLDRQFDADIRLLGFELSDTRYAAGEAIPLTLIWEAAAPIPQRYKVFTHLEGRNFNPATGNPLWGQQDNEPANNRRPTTTWRSGEVIVDTFDIPISAAAPSGTYTLKIGLYDPVSGDRLLLENGGNHLLLATIEIEAR